ncbi:MAG: cobaltochelatase subunit CobN, partial [Acetobacteraceae bacterium]|nr:cobaltochelatase subunit CobN [Acetobacteraceae bacterium]
RALRDGGWRVEVPDTEDALRRRIIEGNASVFGTPANVAARIPADTLLRRERWIGEIERHWGPAPGRHQSDGGAVLVFGEAFGNVFVGIQPAFGVEGDPMRLLFEHSFAPTHAFAAFYRYVRETFGADAVLHFGTHGALEFMPGKQVGLSGKCWPDRLIGDLPNFYLYASNNPSEGALAKRRAGAALISYLTPPIAHAGLYRGLLDLKASLDRWRALDPVTAAGQVAALAGLVQAQAAAVDLAPAEPVWKPEERAAAIARIVEAVYELESTLIPHGLHVIGAPPDTEARASMLDAAGVSDPARRAELDRLLATDHETPAILHALDGGYLRPAPGGDLLRNTDVLPTGRNLHGFDPFRIPSAFAVQDGARQAERLLARYADDGLGLPETLALVLWGTDNLKTEGGPIAQALWLLGAKPRHDSYGRLAGAQLIPLDQLGRPRIDVVVTLSGIFRDLLPMQTRLLAEAARLAAEADEPLECNFVRKHALALIEAQGGDIAEASLRVFGNADGAYGANVNMMLDHGAWQDEDELADAYIRRKGFAYGVNGRPERRDAVLSHMLSSVDATYQNLDSVELGVTTIDHYFDSLGGISRAVRRVRGATAPVYVGDQTRGEGKIRSIAEQVALETRTRALNPKWYEALLAHGYEGVRHIEAHVTNTLGWSATTGQVAPWVYQNLAETYVLDDAMRERLARLNPTASVKIANRLLEAHERKYWSPDDATLDGLRRAGEELEDRLEGIAVEEAAA